MIVNYRIVVKKGKNKINNCNAKDKRKEYPIDNAMVLIFVPQGHFLACLFGVCLLALDLLFISVSQT